MCQVLQSLLSIRTFIRNKKAPVILTVFKIETQRYLQTMIAMFETTSISRIVSTVLDFKSAAASTFALKLAVSEHLHASSDRSDPITDSQVLPGRARLPTTTARNLAVG